MVLTLTIVSKNTRFLESAAEIRLGYPPKIRLLCPSDADTDASNHRVRIVPSDAFGNLYGPTPFADLQQRILDDWTTPFCIDDPTWYRIDNTICILSPCLLPGCIPYKEGTCIPYRAFSSCLRLMNTLSSSYPIEDIVVPALCCEPGGIDPEVSALQIFQAWREYLMSRDGIPDKTYSRFAD